MAGAQGGRNERDPIRARLTWRQSSLKGGTGLVWANAASIAAPFWSHDAASATAAIKVTINVTTSVRRFGVLSIEFASLLLLGL